jgi:hypothetical protein
MPQGCFQRAVCFFVVVAVMESLGEGIRLELQNDRERE